MAKRLANEVLVWIESGVAGTYNVIRGQQGCTINRNADSIDLTTKDDGGYGTSAPGTKTLTIDLSVIPNLPDANGYTRLETLATAATPAPFRVQLRKGGLAGVNADAIFEGSVYANLDSTAFDQNSAATVKVTFTAAAAPTTDILS